MKTYSAVFVTDAWEASKDEMIVSFESPNSSKEVLVKLAKIAFAKDIYDYKPKEAKENDPPEKLVEEEAADLEKLVIEMENDGFYIKLVGIFEGRTFIDKSGVVIC